LLRQQLPGFKVVMKEGFPAIMFNSYYMRISIDGNGLPFQVPPFPTVNDVISEMKEYKIASFVGLEVMYSRRFTNRLFGALKMPKFTPGLPGVEMKKQAAAIAAGYTGNISFNEQSGQSYTDWRISLLRGDQDLASIEITTRLKSGWIRNNRPDFATYRPLPVTYAQEFYSPKYIANEKNALIPDYRSTIFWKPDVTTDVDGKAKFSFYSSDITGNYTVNLQGSDMDGNIGTALFTVKVVHQAP
jgi:hypothetical protein